MGAIRLFDSHLHLTDRSFADDRAEVLARARASGVAEMVTVASDPDDARRAVELARSTPGVGATAGLHPHEAAALTERTLEELETLTREPEVVAIGEAGLDYHYDNAPRDAQRRCFRGQVELAESTGLPIVVHSREADSETAEIVSQFAGRVTGVLHCFTGGDELLAAGLEADWYVSFSGIVTFKRFDRGDQVCRVPQDRLLIETDSPYLAPVPMRGRRNEPAHLLHTCRRVAEIRGVAPDVIAEITRRNTLSFYGLEQ